MARNSRIAVVAFASQNPERADLGLGTGTVALSATVNNLAATMLLKTGGAGGLAGSFDTSRLQV